MRRRDCITLVGGVALMWPLAARAQEASAPKKIGVLWHAGSAEEEGPYYKALVAGFNDLGYIDGHHIQLEHRFPNETPERFTSMAAELVLLKVSVLVCVGNVAAPYAKNATSTIPVVFVLVPDPVGSKLVDGLAWPGGNVTGLASSASELFGKRLHILKEIIPGLKNVGQLVNSSVKASQLHIQATKDASAELGLTVQTFDARTLNDLEAAFDAMAKAGMQAVTINPEGIAFQGRAIIPKLALERRLSLCAYSRETFEHGALFSYGADSIDSCRRVAVVVDKILKGTHPKGIAVEQPKRFEFLINLKTATTLGLSIPPTLLAFADEVIE